MTNTHLFLRPYQILQSKKYEINVVAGGPYRSPGLQLTQVSSGKSTNLATDSFFMASYLGYLANPFNPIDVKAILDNFFAITKAEELKRPDSLERYLRAQIINNLNQGIIEYDFVANQGILKGTSIGLALPLIRIFCQQAGYGVYNRDLYNFLEVLYSAPFITSLAVEGRLNILQRVLPIESLITDSGYIGFYAKTDSVGYLLGDDETTKTLFNLTKPGTVVYPQARLQCLSEIHLSNPLEQSVWKVLVSPRDITNIDDRGVIYVNRFIPVKEITHFKDNALLYNMSAERINAFLKKVPKHALPKADYIPPEPCYWGIEYYDDRSKEHVGVPCGVLDQS